MQCQTLANEVSQHQLITCGKQSVHVCMQSEFITKACSNVVITWAFERKMLLVLNMLLSQFETVLAEALRPLDALVSAHGHSQLVAAKADAAQRAEQPELGREAHIVERSRWCTILR